MARRFSLVEKGLLVFEVQNPNVEQYTKVAAVVQNAILCYHVIYDQKRVLLPRHHWIIFFKKVNRTESRKEPEPGPSRSGMSETAACPPSPIAEDPSALPSPTASPFSS